ncbi:T9SS type A sorting domain-containing protein [Aequorivita echinoideorum]|uniref:T9SS type A sorting domain-containing protein n=1 Tax=Aequorivita echinoideorum TaxID=1549647 RepID=A0ABS5S3P3_9FLAO|nr:T9SS type A sorting domain-containing protein [Aequorivita echinoideorum]MBT0607832.1 T9SS type A sorting domain-containing protein [Aequorivita echinoideorum]
MKKFILFALTLCAFEGFAQDPELFGTWYLASYTADMEDPNFISAIQPPVSPYIIIDENLEFLGEGACNSYIGNFAFDSNSNELILNSFDSTLGLCNFEEHNNFEVDYFSYFQVDYSYEFDISEFNSGIMQLVLSFSPGFDLVYQNEPLSISDNFISEFKIYPNPVSDKLFISSKKSLLESLIVYSMTGQKMMEISNENNIDVSSFPKGMYFLEIISAEGKTIKKFIKN